jgi:hypothetical protein
MLASTEKFTPVKIALCALLTGLLGLAGCGHRSFGITILRPSSQFPLHILIDHRALSYFDKAPASAIFPRCGIFDGAE